MPTWNQLKALANKTKRPLAAFYLPSPPEVPKRPRDFRTYPGAVFGQFSPKLLQLIREARSLRTQALELLDAADEPPEFPQLPVFRIRDNAAECAETIRGFLGVTVEEQVGWEDGYTALNAWREILFGKGVFVVQLPIKGEEARGFSENYDRLNLIAVSSHEDNPCPRIFTIFHELCHLCLRWAGVSDRRSYVEDRGHHATIERFCDRVAGAFLVPLDNETVREHLERIVASGQVDMAELRKASNRLKASQSAILYRMVEGHLIGDTEYHDILECWKSRPLRPRRSILVPVPRRRLGSVGRPYASIVLNALDVGRISTHEACNLLGIKPRWLESMRTETYAGVAYA